MSYDAIKEMTKQYNKVYYAKNKEKILAKAKERSQDEEVKARRKAYRKAYWLKNKK